MISSISRVAIAFACLVLLGAGQDGCEQSDEPIALGAENRSQFIINGQETNYEIWKGVVGIGPGRYNCSASLIDPEVLLTAGHCFDPPANAYDVFGGADLNYRQSTIVYPHAKEGVDHPDDDTDPRVDLAVISLVAPITEVESYCVRSEPVPKLGSDAIIVGYGRASPTYPTLAGVHRMGETHIYYVSPRTIEISGDSGTCFGDSGGPLFADQNGEWMITGVHATVYDATCPIEAGNHDMNVLTYRGWIEDQVIAFTGHGLPERCLGGSDADTDTDTDTDADTDSDTDADRDSDEDAGADEDAGDGEDAGGTDAGQEADPADSGCGCKAAGQPMSGTAGPGAFLSLLLSM